MSMPIVCKQGMDDVNNKLNTPLPYINHYTSSTILFYFV